MDAHDRPFGLQGSLGSANHQSADTTVPSQVLFMDTHDLASRTNMNPPSSTYYQVATPKSPHELALDGDDDEVHGSNPHNHSMEHNSLSDNHIGPHDIGLGKSNRESEEIERVKYESAKNEILDKLHLHTLINHKELDRLQLEIRRTDANMELLKKLHDDENLLEKIETYHEREKDKKKQQLFDENAMRAYSSENFIEGATISTPSRIGFHDVPSTNNSMPMHHYHTRSKSQGQVSIVPHLRPADTTIMDLRMSGAKSIPITTSGHGTNDSGCEILPFRPNQMNLHHRRNYSSTSLTSNSGVVGKDENNEAIFRRYDGILIIITCSNCKRSGFTSAQGIVNHARLKHGKTYSSQPLAVLNNQKILEDDKQDPQVLEKFKEMGKDPGSEYLPCEIAIPSSSRRSSNRETSPKGTVINKTENHNGNISVHQVGHLEKMYNKDDFKDLVEMVNEARNDLDIVLKQSESDDELNESEENTVVTRPCAPGTAPTTIYSNDNKDSTSISESTTGAELNEISLISDGNGSNVSSTGPQKKNSKKRKSEEFEQERELKERLRPAEKKARPDVLAFSNIPDNEKRSTHYNLRAKSKLRSSNSKYQ